MLLLHIPSSHLFCCNSLYPHRIYLKPFIFHHSKYFVFVLNVNILCVLKAILYMRNYRNATMHPVVIFMIKWSKFHGKSISKEILRKLANFMYLHMLLYDSFWDICAKGSSEYISILTLTFTKCCFIARILMNKIWIKQIHE